MTHGYKFATVSGRDVFYRESGPADAPVVVLLHGFPSSSHMFRELMPKLADRYRVIAPDLVGFGYSAQPAATDFEYTFDNLSAIVEQLLFDGLSLRTFSLYLQDYGAPVGLRIAARHPEAIDALVVQNGNAYVEGLSEAWAPIRALWTERSAASEHGVRALLTLATTKFQYTHGARDVDRISPDAYTFDQWFLDRPGNADAQIALFADYQTNIAQYPEWQAYFRRHQPPTLIVWGARDPFFTADGARAFLRDLPHAELHLFDTGHFALEDHVDAIAARMRTFLDAVHRARERKATTIVLVHGAWADGSSWRTVSADLYRRGFDVVAAQLPLTSLRDDVATLQRVIRAQSGPIVLVGHSYGGAVVTAAGADEANVIGLVYVAAMAPDTGETVGELFVRAQAHPLAPAIRPDADGFVSLTAADFTRAFMPDAETEVAVLVAMSQKPVSVRCMSEPMTSPAWTQKPSWYLLCERDYVLSPETQRFMAERARADLTSLDADHMPLASRPDAVARMIARAAMTNTSV